MYEIEIQRAAQAIVAAEALLIGAGAGMSVDAGIPAYRLNPASRPAAPPGRSCCFARPDRTAGTRSCKSGP